MRYACSTICISHRFYFHLIPSPGILLMNSQDSQGSLLGPMLFLLFVNYLPETVTSSRVACYADDTKVFRTVDSVSDCVALKSDLLSLVNWSRSSGLQFNQSKCKLQRITRKKKPALYDYSFNGKNLETVDAEKDLGVWATSDLTWDKQTSEQCAKANKLLQLALCAVHPKAYEVCRHGAHCT